MMALPTDTILDSTPPNGLTLNATNVLKALYLKMKPLQKLQKDNNWSDTELINAVELARQEGFLKITIEDNVFSIQLTPSGAVQGWLSKYNWC